MELNNDFNKNLRLDYYVWSRCNSNCIFCFDQWLKYIQSTNKDTKTIKRQLTLLNKLSNHIVFIWWEASIRSDIIELIEYSKKLWYQKIWLITNWVKFADISFCEDIFKAWLNEIVLSFHTSNEVLSNYTSRTRNFRKILEWAINISNLSKKYSINLTSNTVVTKINFHTLIQISKLLSKIWIKYQNYWFLEYTGDANINKNIIWIRYSEASKYINDLLDFWIISNSVITLEWFPYCLLKEEKQNLNFLKRQISFREKIYWEVIWFTKSYDVDLYINNMFDKKSLNKSLKLKFISDKCIKCRYLWFCPIPKSCKDFYMIWHLNKKFKTNIIYDKYIEIYWDEEFKTIN